MSGTMRYYLIEYFDYQGNVSTRFLKRFASVHDARYYAYCGTRYNGKRYSVYVKV
jgi:hypothetical protein